MRELEAELRRAPEKREAPRALASEMTRLVHSADAVARAEHASGLLFGEGITELNVDEVLSVFDDVPSTEVEAGRLADPGLAIAEALVLTGLASSKGEAARLVKGGGIYVNNRRVSDERARLLARDAIGGQLFVVRKGARTYHLLQAR